MRGRTAQLEDRLGEQLETVNAPFSEMSAPVLTGEIASRANPAAAIHPFADSAEPECLDPGDRHVGERVVELGDVVPRRVSTPARRGHATLVE